MQMDNIVKKKVPKGSNTIRGKCIRCGARLVKVVGT